MDSIVGEIRPFAGNYAPEGWLPCDGRSLSIQEYELLYALIGVAYGGNGTTTFNLPDLRGRLPVGQGQGTGLTNRTLGQTGGASGVTLAQANLPAHSHGFSVSGNQGSTNTPSTGATLAVPQAQTGGTMYAYATPGTGTAQTFAADTITTSPGNSLPHNNLMPYLAINYIIAVTGLFPNRPN